MAPLRLLTRAGSGRVGALSDFPTDPRSLAGPRDRFSEKGGPAKVAFFSFSYSLLDKL
jgi:hypothetical protein